MEHRKLAVAIDGSEYSGSVLNQGIAYARLLGAELLLVHCHKKFPKIAGSPYKEEAVAAILNEADKLLQPYLDRLQGAQVQFDKRLMEGPPAPAISRVAEIEHCELIIMGSRGLTELEGLFLGSVTHRVLQTATCPVLVVK